MTDAYPGGMSRGLRNKLTFAQAVRYLPNEKVNAFLQWVGANCPVKDPGFSRHLDVSALFREFLRATS